MDLTSAMLDASGCLMLLVEVDTGLIRAANKASERLTGFEQHELVGRSVWDVLGSSTARGDLRESFSGPPGAGIPVAFEATVPSKDGGSRRVVWSGAFLTDGLGPRTHAVMTGIDVTTEWASAGLLNHLMRAATATAVVGADLEGRITFFSAGAEAMLGYSAEELIGRTAPAEAFESPEFLTLTADQDERYATRDWNMVRKDGTRFIASVTVSPVTDCSGRRTGYLGIALDVTDERRREGLLVEALERERLAVERLAALDRTRDTFIATVSHELRTPLTSITLSAELLRDDGDSGMTPGQASRVEAICRNAQRLGSMVNDLLLLTSLESPTPESSVEEVDVRQVIDEAKADLEDVIAGHGAAVQFEIPELPVHVTGDRSHLASLVRHLLSNALKATTDGERVHCSLQVVGDRAHLEVADNGFGIHASEHDQIFTKFFRSSTSRGRAIQGSGLGLAIVRGVVERMGGEIAVESGHLAGATFSVRLPLSPRRA